MGISHREIWQSPGFPVVHTFAKLTVYRIVGVGTVFTLHRRNDMILLLLFISEP
jgi:hypothetical protein